MDATDRMDLAYELCKHDTAVEDGVSPITPDTIHGSTRLMGSWWSRPSDWRTHVRHLATHPTQLQTSLLSIGALMTAVLFCLVVARLLVLRLTSANPTALDLRIKTHHLTAALAWIAAAVVVAGTTSAAASKASSAWRGQK